jgi:hypothetical protein
MKNFVMASFSVVLSVGLFSARVLADSEKNFEERKAEHLKEIDEKIQKMQDHRNCVANSKATEDLKKCREAMKEFHKAEKLERLENRKKGLDKKMEEMKK